VKRTLHEVLFTLGYLAAGLVAALAVGFLEQRSWLFHYPTPLVSYLVPGVMGALIYASAQMRGPGWAALSILIAVLAWLTIDPLSFSLLAAAAYALLVGFPMMGAAYIQKSLGRVKLGRFVVMGVITGAGYALVTLLFLAMSDARIRLTVVLREASDGLLMGAAMGLGFELIDLIGPRPSPKRQ